MYLLSIHIGITIYTQSTHLVLSYCLCLIAHTYPVLENWTNYVPEVWAPIVAFSHYFGLSLQLYLCIYKNIN